MLYLPIVDRYEPIILNKHLAQMPDLALIAKEQRHNFSANFPLHNRFFSNGDKPLVALINHRGLAELYYDKTTYMLTNNMFVLFDDNVLHSWVMNNCDLEIFYYRQTSEIAKAIKTGNYCLDNFF